MAMQTAGVTTMKNVHLETAKALAVDKIYFIKILQRETKSVTFAHTYLNPLWGLQNE
jgi:hypothetical protein